MHFSLCGIASRDDEHVRARIFDVVLFDFEPCFSFDVHLSHYGACVVVSLEPCLSRPREPRLRAGTLLLVPSRASASGSRSLAALEPSPARFVIEYWPTALHDEDPGVGHPDVQWSPLGWLRGRNKIVQWIGSA